MHIFFNLLLLSLGLAACVSEQKRTSASGSDQSDTIQVSPDRVSPDRQGIQGKVLWLEGNLMPSVVEDSSKMEADRGTPVERTLYIYKLTHQDQAKLVEGFYTEIRTDLVKKVKTGEDGQFKTYLEPGRYSLFVEEPQGLYANLFDGEGYIHPVTVMKDSVSQVTLKVDYKAVY